MSKFDVMKIDGHAAVVSFGPDVEIFRGEFIKPRGQVFHFAFCGYYAVDVVGDIFGQNGFVGAAALLPARLERLIASSPCANVGFEWRTDPNREHVRRLYYAGASAGTASEMVHVVGGAEIVPNAEPARRREPCCCRSRQAGGRRAGCELALPSRP